MTQALLTIIAPLPVCSVAEARACIAALGNPARPDIAAALGTLDGDAGVHFMSLNAITSTDGARAHLVLELSADGPQAAALARLVKMIGERLRAVFAIAADWKPGGDLRSYLRAHVTVPGCGWLDRPGLAFSGSPGFTVGRIRAEADLAARAWAVVGAQPACMPAMSRLKGARRALDLEPNIAAGPVAAGPAVAAYPLPLTVAQMIGCFLWTYCWPVGLGIAGWSAYKGVSAAAAADLTVAVPKLLFAMICSLFTAFWYALGAMVMVAVFGYLLFRWFEARDPVCEQAATDETLAALFDNESHLAQNHMLSINSRKPGLLRAFTLRFAFWLIEQVAYRFWRPGYLGDIGTIHFARWVTVPGSRDLLFLSNYDGSWESYLEDFIKRAHRGLTAVWSNTAGFPRAANLFQKGATDGGRFKRFARRSMRPTQFWYSGYPTLSVGEIRRNAGIARGLTEAESEDEARQWLALFGSAPRSDATLEGNEIQSLIFGGLGFLPFGTCLFYDVPADVAAARQWLSMVSRYIAYGEGKRLDAQAVLTLAVSARGLQRLGLPDDGWRSFPFAYRQGMTSAARRRILGDAGASAPEHWHWGRENPDVALLVYGKTAGAVAKLEGSLARIGAEFGAVAVHRVDLKEVKTSTVEDRKEPFGFVDAISQPIIRGTDKSRRKSDPIHLVEAGEFVLGYPDNTGDIPPGPLLSADHDPGNVLPLANRSAIRRPRDLGRNGSFLVIRELEQDVPGFHAFCAEQANRLATRFPEPLKITADVIGAKLIGRWQDGSSLSRHPLAPASSGPRAPKPGSRAGAALHESDVSDNDFLFGRDDAAGFACPLGSHIRRANPRDSLEPGSADQIAISNRHRILRVGRRYVEEGGRNPGLLFMCLCGDLERQFEFLQQTWLRGSSFHNLVRERDPISSGDLGADGAGMTIPTRDGPIALTLPGSFVTTRGGGYFFVPGKRLLQYLSSPR